MRVIRIEAENFLSYPRLTLDTNKRGVVLVTGANGSGKSAALVDALAFGLYGKTVRGLAGDDVIHDPQRTGAGKNAVVRVFLLDEDGVEHVVERHRKDGKLRNQVLVNGVWHGTAKAADEAIARLINLRWETFCVAAVFGQGLVTRFSAAGDSERKRILDEMLGLERFEAARRIVTGRAAAAKLVLQQAQRDAASHEGWVASLQQSIAEAERQGAAWGEQLAARVAGLQVDLGVAQGAAAEVTPDYSAELAQLDSLCSDLEVAHKQDVAAARAAVVEAEAAQDAADARLSRLRLDQAAGAARRKTLSEALAQAERQERLANWAANDALSKLVEAGTALDKALSLHPEGETCPTCGVHLVAAARARLLPESAAQGAAAVVQRAQDQAVAVATSASAEHDRCTAELRFAEAQTAAARDALAKFQEVGADDAAMAEASAAAADARQVAAEARRASQVAVFQHPSASALISARERAAALRQAAATAAGRAEAAAARVAALEAQIKTVASAENPHTVAVASLRGQVAQHAASAAEAAETAAKAETEIADLAFWAIAFGPAGIRSLLYDEVLPALNRAARKYSRALSGGRMTVHFDTESELKSGEKRDRFGAVTSLDVGAGSYEACSGGWRQRSDLVQLFALRHAVASRSGGLGLLVLDEALTYVDAPGIEAAADLVREIAADVGTVFLCTHDIRLQAEFSTVAHVVNEGGVSTLHEGAA